MDLNFSGNYHKFIDLENNSEIILDNLDLRDEYSSKVSEYAKLLRFKALQYKMDYQMIDIKNGFRNAIVAYLLQRKKIF